MAVVSYITVLPHLSPRIVRVDLPFTEVALQDMHDTLAAWQDEPPNHDYDVIVDSAGKEPIGGGVQVGITMTLQNAQLQFAARVNVVAAGTVTTADPLGLNLIDSGASFLSTAERGYLLQNATDSSAGTVLESVSDTNLALDGLAGGANTFTFGDAYQLFEVVVCRVAGGNLTAVDEFGAAMDVMLPSFGVSYDRALSTSASLIEGSGVDVAAVADAVWDEVLTGGTHNINNSAGKRLRNLAAQVVHTDTARGPATNGNQIELALSASSVDGAYDPSVLAIVDGLGAGQSRNVLEYDGTNRIATVDRNWKTNPDATSEYVIYADAGREHVNEGLSQGGTATTITLNALASGIDDVYLHQTIFIRSGTGDDQVALVTGYDGATKVATISGTWAVTPDTTSAYAMLPFHNNVQTEQFISYANVIHIDVANGSAGQLYPIGTGLEPVNNLADAKVLGALYGIEEFVIAGTLVCGASDVLDGLILAGSNALVDTLVLVAGCSTVNTIFRSMVLTGAVDGGVFAEKCALVNLSGIGSDSDPSLFNECILIESTITFRAGLTTPTKVQFIQCVSGVATATGTIIDYNGTTQPSAFRKYSGDVTLRNHSAAVSSLWELENGEVTVEASCTAGTVLVRGRADVIDNAAGTVVDKDGSIFPAKHRALMNAILGNVV